MLRDVCVRGVEPRALWELGKQSTTGLQALVLPVLLHGVGFQSRCDWSDGLPKGQSQKELEQLPSPHSPLCGGSSLFLPYTLDNRGEIFSEVDAPCLCLNPGLPQVENEASMDHWAEM